MEVGNFTQDIFLPTKIAGLRINRATIFHLKLSTFNVAFELLPGFELTASVLCLLPDITTERDEYFHNVGHESARI